MHHLVFLLASKKFDLVFCCFHFSAIWMLHFESLHYWLMYFFFNWNPLFFNVGKMILGLRAFIKFPLSFTSSGNE